ncbi:hypothetical protein GT370_00475 [Acidocella sp. MX-AZ03]|nr:hypothetical protein [Acidocella sp. MX-AZ03]WBO59463.1 hypothetical protein GT370_00475 [Acidocella sp. MX-AZ03]
MATLFANLAMVLVAPTDAGWNLGQAPHLVADAPEVRVPQVADK